MKKAGIFAGGAAWGAYLVGVLTSKRPQYDAFIGTSTGALIALFLALGRIDPKFYDYLIHEYSNTDNREMYGRFSPFKRNGKVNKLFMIGAVIRMIKRDTNYMYDITPALRYKIRRYFKERHFDELRKRKINVIVTSKNVDFKKSGTMYTSILRVDMTYNRFVEHVVSSAAIPFFAKPVVVNGQQHVDGGVLDPVPNTDLVGSYEEIEIWLAHSKQSEQPVSNKADSWMKLALNLFNDIRYEIKMDDVNAVTDATVHHARHMDWNSAHFDYTLMRKAIKRGQEDFKDGMI